MLVTLLNNENDNRLKRLRICGHLFDLIIRVSNELSATFSFSVIVNLTILMIVCATTLFFGLFPLMPGNGAMMISLSVAAIIFVLIIFKAADSPIQEVLNFISDNSISRTTQF